MLRRTLDRLAEATTFAETIVLGPGEAGPEFQAALAGCSNTLGPLRVMAGGQTRQQSVAIGVAALQSQADVVCVHDAARPLVAPSTVRLVLEAARFFGAATAAARPTDSVRQDLAEGGSRALDRSGLWLVETPQAFGRDLLEKAHRAASAAGLAYTDDASLVEALGVRIQMVESEGRNLKVTIEADLLVAATMLGVAR